MVNVGSKTGIMLDPVYTGKAAKGLVTELQNNPDLFQGNRILFLHTGKTSLFNPRYVLQICSFLTEQCCFQLIFHFSQRAEFIQH